jgi:hypothetical protein
MHTNHPHYEESFNEVVEQREQGKLTMEADKSHSW